MAARALATAHEETQTASVQDGHVTVTYGARQPQQMPFVGRTVGTVRAFMNETGREIPPDAKAFVDGKPVGDNHVLGRSEELEFLQQAPKLG